MFDGICHSLYIVDDLQYVQQECYQIKKIGKINTQNWPLKKKSDGRCTSTSPRSLFIVAANAILISYHPLHILKVMVRSDKRK